LIRNIRNLPFVPAVLVAIINTVETYVYDKVVRAAVRVPAGDNKNGAVALVSSAREAQGDNGAERQ